MEMLNSLKIFFFLLYLLLLFRCFDEHCIASPLQASKMKWSIKLNQIDQSEGKQSLEPKRLGNTDTGEQYFSER